MTPPSQPIVVGAAGHLGLAGYGNDRTGLRPWPEATRRALASGDVEAVHWSHVFPSDPQRFARMDPLCRIGLMAVELLDVGFDRWEPGARERVGLVAETAGGCVTTDVRFLETPRPSLFAYTLPSTVLGEVCIRHRLQGPLLCLLTPDGRGRSILEEAVDWLCTGVADRVVCLSCEAVAGLAASQLTVVPAGLWQANALLLARGGPGLPVELAADVSVAALGHKLCIDNPGLAPHAFQRASSVER